MSCCLRSQQRTQGGSKEPGSWLEMVALRSQVGPMGLRAARMGRVCWTQKCRTLFLSFFFSNNFFIKTNPF